MNWKYTLFSKNFEEHLFHLDEVFQKLREANLRLKPSKCNFAVKEVKYLGHVISKDGISVDQSKVEAVKSFSEPKNTTDIRAFLGLANYYRKFIKGFSEIATPLNMSQVFLGQRLSKRIRYTETNAYVSSDFVIPRF